MHLILVSQCAHCIWLIEGQTTQAAKVNDVKPWMVLLNILLGELHIVIVMLFHRYHTNEPTIYYMK